MKIIAICVIKNEVDIIERTIIDALKWADKIIIADHESNDGTWELICEKLSSYENVEVYGQITGIFNDDLRGEIYRKYEHLANPGDWWCRLDSDEIYIDNPREFLVNISNRYSVVRCAKFQYYFTDLDLKIYNNEPSLYENGNCVDSMKYYVCNESETRFFRHIGIGWNKGNIWPNTRWPHLIAPQHIRLKHFQYRYPKQIQMRIDIRSQVRAQSEVFSHEARADWVSKINNNAKMNQDNSVLDFSQTWKDRIIEHSILEFDNGKSYIITQQIMTAKIRPVPLQLIRNTIFLFKGCGCNITTR